MDDARFAGLVLAGGGSRRMGRDKASLAWHGSTLAHRVAGLLARALAPVLVVAAEGQALPRLPRGVEVVRDEHAGQGPLQGLASGLSALEGRAQAGFVAAVDLPFLHPALVEAVCAALGQADAAVPRVGGFDQPLAACYRVALAARAGELLAAGERRAAGLAPAGRTVRLDEAALRHAPALAAHDPALQSFRAVHDPAAYAAALAEPLPRVRVLHGGAIVERRAACLAAVPELLGTMVLLNGRPSATDAELPLAEHDVLERCP